MDEYGEFLDRRFAKPWSPGRHDAVTGSDDLGNDGVPGVAVEPDRIGEIGGAERDVALAFLAVAGGAMSGVESLAVGVRGESGDEARQDDRCEAPRAGSAPSSIWTRA